MTRPTLAVFSATPREIEGGFELFASMLVDEGCLRGVEARIVTPPGSQFRTVTRLLGLGRRFAHLKADAKGEHLDFAKRASHVYLKGEPLDLAWWRLVGNPKAVRVVGMHTPLRYPPAGAPVRLRNALYASAIFGALVGRKSKLHLLSRHQRAQLPRGIRNNVTAVIPNGVVSTERLPARAPGSSLRFLFVGRLTDQKGLERVAPLFAAVPIGTLTVLGDGPERKSLEDAFGDRARFYGQVSREVVAQTMMEHDVLLMPSRWEGHPFTLLEAMASGCIPLVQRLPELVDVLPAAHQWLAVDYDEPQTVEAAVNRLYALAADPEKWSVLRQELHAFVREKFDASKQLRLVLDFTLEGDSR